MDWRCVLGNEHGMSTPRLVTFMSNSVAKRLGRAEFENGLSTLCKVYGMSTEQLVTIMSNGVAKRLGTAEFDHAVSTLCKEYGMSTEQRVKFMSGGAAARQQDAGTVARFWRSTFGGGDGGSRDAWLW